MHLDGGSIRLKPLRVVRVFDALEQRNQLDCGQDVSRCARVLRSNTHTQTATERLAEVTTERDRQREGESERERERQTPDASQKSTDE
jgi:hypothetical protein